MSHHQNATSSSKLSTISGIVCALNCAVFSGLIAIVLRQLALKKIHYSVVSIFTSYFGLPVSLIGALVMQITDSQAKSRELLNNSQLLVSQLSYGLLMATVATVATVLINLSLQYEEASKIAIMRPLDVFFTFLLQRVFLGITSNLASILGAILIVCGSLFCVGYKILDKKVTKDEENRKSMKVSDTGQQETNETSLLKRILFYKF